jgi:hypothetical protein
MNVLTVFSFLGLNLSMFEVGRQMEIVATRDRETGYVQSLRNPPCTPDPKEELWD